MGALAGAFRPDPAGLPVGAAASLAQPWRQVFQFSDLDLEASLAGFGMAVKDLDDDPGAVEHFGASGRFEIAQLVRRQLRVKDDDGRLEGLGDRLQLRFIGVWWRLCFEILAGLPLAPGLWDLRGDDATAAG